MKEEDLLSVLILTPTHHHFASCGNLLTLSLFWFFVSKIIFMGSLLSFLLVSCLFCLCLSSACAQKVESIALQSALCVRGKAHTEDDLMMFYIKNKNTLM